MKALEIEHDDPAAARREPRIAEQLAEAASRDRELVRLRRERAELKAENEVLRRANQALSSELAIVRARSIGVVQPAHPWPGYPLVPPPVWCNNKPGDIIGPYPPEIT